jgi:GT2 family glycosyltransferase
VLVVDNASTDGTAELLAQEGLMARIRYERREVNDGGAGGYAAGVALAASLGHDWLWLMDDDAEPRPDALERLLASPPAADPGTAVLATSVRTPTGELELVHRGHFGRFMRTLDPAAYENGYARLGFASFVGYLVRGDVARALGPVRAEFFIGCDDLEYSVRARRHGEIRLVPESVIVHKLGMGGGSSTRRSRFWNRALGFGYTSASWDGYWKNLYAIRNFMWVKHRYGHVSPIAFAGLTVTYVVKTLMYDRRPLRRIPWIVRYALKGRRGDFTGPTPAEWIARHGS